MKSLIITLLTLGLIACGYHLRNTNNLAVTYPKLQLNIKAQSPLKRPLVNALIASGITLSENPQDDSLNIKKDTLRKVIQSIGANNNVQEYRLEYDVHYSIANQEVRNIHLEKDYSFDIQQITGGQQEEITLRKQLAEDMAWALIRQINATIENSDSKK